MAGNAPELQKIGGVFTFLTNIITDAERRVLRPFFSIFILIRKGGEKITGGEIISPNNKYIILVIYIF